MLNVGEEGSTQTHIYKHSFILLLGGKGWQLTLSPYKSLWLERVGRKIKLGLLKRSVVCVGSSWCQAQTFPQVPFKNRHAS